ncbi:MAG: TolC family protein [Bacteroidetes bacterium]|nr:MAG: TolC family protein [Bacteroidota bacterium]
MKQLLLTILVVFPLLMNVGNAQQDSSVLSFRSYMDYVMSTHPMARQAALKDELAQAEWMRARGNFDPEISSGWNDKFFDDKHYYRLFATRVNVPLRYGLEITGAYENTDGVYLNPENKTDENGLWTLGVQVNLLQGLLIDERRAGLQQAVFFQEIAENQKINQLNDLAYQASAAYLNWQRDYYAQQVVLEAIELAEVYFEATRQSFFNGEKTAMDTLEALIIVQDRTAQLRTNEALLTKSQQTLENFLWRENQPLSLLPGVFPEQEIVEINPESLRVPVETMVNAHPVLLEKQNKKAYYQIEQRLKKEKLKPKLKLKYNPLLATSEQSLTPVLSASNYKWGFDFSMPLFLRSERAGLQKSRLKIREIDFDIQDKSNALKNKIQASEEQMAILRDQLELQRRNVDGYLKLLEAENEKNRFGESSVFLINKRQEKYVAGRIKLIDLNRKYKLEQLNYLYFSNQLLSVFND